MTIQSIAADFCNIRGEEDLAAFVAKYMLRRAVAGGMNATYSGSAGGFEVEVRERWWDPSNAYAAQHDQHEVVLLVESKVAGRIQFTGSS